MEQQVLFWIFVTIFSATAVITLLGITNVISIKNNFLNAMFTALILEVVAAVIILFQGFDFSGQESSVDLNQLISEANLATQLEPRQNPEAFIIAKLKSSEKVVILNEELELARQEADSLLVVLENCEGQSGDIQEDLGKYKGSFFGKITSLRELITKYGGVINIAFQEKEKVEVYKLLIDIFSDLGLVANATPIYKDAAKTQINYNTVQGMYRSFRKDYGRPVEDKNYIYVTDLDTILMMQRYINLIAPIKKEGEG